MLKVINYTLRQVPENKVINQGSLPDWYSQNDCFVAIAELHNIRHVSGFEFESDGKKIVVNFK